MPGPRREWDFSRSPPRSWSAAVPRRVAAAAYPTQATRARVKPPDAYRGHASQAVGRRPGGSFLGAAQIRRRAPELVSYRRAVADEPQAAGYMPSRGTTLR